MPVRSAPESIALSAALTLTGNLSATQREELLRAGRKGPVHKLMTEVATEIAVTLEAMQR
jgi:putative redox protein